MSIFNIANFKESVKWFVCASTPNYLYTNLKDLQEVENLSLQLSADELYAFCKQTIERKEKNRESELECYIYLVALSFKTYSESSAYLIELKTKEYKWANSIISLIISKSNIITEETINVKFTPNIIVSDEEMKDITTDSTISDITIDLED